MIVTTSALLGSEGNLGNCHEFAHHYILLYSGISRLSNVDISSGALLPSCPTVRVISATGCRGLHSRTGSVWTGLAASIQSSVTNAPLRQICGSFSNRIKTKTVYGVDGLGPLRQVSSEFTLSFLYVVDYYYSNSTPVRGSNHQPAPYI